MAYAVPLPEGSFKSVMRVLLALIIVFRTLTIPHLFILLHRCAPDYSATAPDSLWVASLLRGATPTNACRTDVLLTSLQRSAVDGLLSACPGIR